MENNGIIYDIIDSYMRDDNPSETVTGCFRNWLTDGMHAREKGQALEEQWSRMNAALDAIEDSDKNRAQYEMLEHIENTERRGFRMRRLIAAAIVVLFCGLAAFSFITSHRDSASDRISYVTGNWSKGEFTLPDGSHVWLNANSVLEYSDDFNVGPERKVSVKGEAFFDVVKGRRPFVVSLGRDMEVKVHGTRFNVRNSEIFESVQVTLQSGSVELMNGTGGRTMLTPGTCYTYNTPTGTYGLARVNTANFSNWTKPIVTFRDETLGDILTTLEHWYNVRITVENGIDTTLSLSFTLKSEPVYDTFSLLQTLTGYRCTVVDENHAVISK